MSFSKFFKQLNRIALQSSFPKPSAKTSHSSLKLAEPDYLTFFGSSLVLDSLLRSLFFDFTKNLAISSMIITK